VSADDLNTPLGQNTKKKRAFVLPNAVPKAAAGLLGLFIAVFAAWALIVDDPLGGEPMEVVSIGAPPSGAQAQMPAVAPGPAQGPRNYDGPSAAQPPAPGTQTVTIIDGSTGKRQDVPIPSTQPNNNSARVDQRLLENSRHGAIPKIGPDGARPSDLYARAAKAAPGKKDAPRIAIVIQGLGVSASATQEALAKMPEAVTFAFAPYTADAERLVSRARSAGHEVLLQVPMEPFDYPDNDPGPQTLLMTLSAEQNVDRLHWLMSRFQGYVGITNLMGARFTASEASLSPVLREMSKRGLIYLDDGSAPRSVASQIAGANNLPFAKAEVAIDAVPTPANIDRALSRLETLASERGFAVGISSPLPAALDRIERWIKAAESRGYLVVPISAVAVKAKSS
jgi:polysaccharide deacetylase 2 family uncharacterized protein YibQ